MSARFWPELGGAERQLDLLSSWLAGQGHKVTVLCHRSTGRPDREERAGVEIIRFGPAPGSSFRSLLFDLRLWRFLGVSGPGYDLYHVNLASSPALFVRGRAKGQRQPMILKFGASGPFGDARISSSTALGRWKLRRLREGITLYLCPNREIREEFLARGYTAGKLTLFPNAVDTAFFAPPSKERRDRLRRSLGWSGRKAALFAGRLEEQKDPCALVEAWKSVAAGEGGPLLVLAGGGSLEDVLRRLVRKHGLEKSVLLAGAKSSADLRDMLQAADCFVLPSRAEGMSNALLEAMACGLPVLASDIAGNRDLVADGVSGLLYGAGDGAALASRLADLLTSPSRSRELGRGGRMEVEERYSVEKVGRAYLELARSACRSVAGGFAPR